MNTRRELVLGMGALGAAALAPTGWRSAEAQSRLAITSSSRIPNIPLISHEGQKVRFYDDLVRGKVVTINMMYVACADICPTATANLRRVQQLLGARVGRDVFMYSLSLQPALDTPELLKAYAELHRVDPGWLFLTGTPEDIEELRYSLGFSDPDPLVDRDQSTHTGMLRIGNDTYQRWTMAPAMAEPRQILGTINHVSRTLTF
jgi:protein SCO1/2